MYGPLIALLFPFWIVGAWWLTTHVPAPLLVGAFVAAVIGFAWRDHRAGVL
jgi:hypothetical protein